MKRKLFLFLTFALLCISASIFAQTTDAGNTEGSLSLVQKILGGGLFTGLATALFYIKKLAKKGKELLDLPITLLKGISKISIEATQAVSSAKAIFDIIENAADTNMSAKDLVESLKVKIQDTKKELGDIPIAVKQLGDDLQEEWADVVKK